MSGGNTDEIKTNRREERTGDWEKHTQKRTRNEEKAQEDLGFAASAAAAFLAKSLDSGIARQGSTENASLAAKHHRPVCSQITHISFVFQLE